MVIMLTMHYDNGAWICPAISAVCGSCQFAYITRVRVCVCACACVCVCVDKKTYVVPYVRKSVSTK